MADSESGAAVGGGSPADVIAAALVATPSAGSLATIAALDPQAISSVEQVDLLVALDRHASWVASVRLRAMAAVAGPDPSGDGDNDFSDDPFRADDPVREEVAVALRISGAAAGNAITVARDLDRKLEGTGQMLAAGAISYAHAVVMSTECERLTPEDARHVEQIVLTHLGRKTAGQLRRHARRVAARIAPQPPTEDLDAEFAKREVTMYSDGGVMTIIEAVLPAPDAMTVWNALTACGLAGARPDDTRTLAHKRADALTQWAHRALDAPDLPAQQGRKRLETQVIIDIATLLGLANNPGELVGHGPIPARLARDLAADSQWRRLVVDPVTGHLLDYGSHTYTPPAALREFVITRDRTCQFPGCSQPASRTDLDHMKPFTGTHTGGSTSAANLHCLCRRHHKLKTHHRWRIEHNTGASDGESGGESDGASLGSTWTSPRGKHYQTDPPRQLDVGADAVSERPVPDQPAPDRPAPEQSADRLHTDLETRLEQLALAA